MESSPIRNSEVKTQDNKAEAVSRLLSEANDEITQLIIRKVEQKINDKTLGDVSPKDFGEAIAELFQEQYIGSQAAFVRQIFLEKKFNELIEEFYKLSQNVSNLSELEGAFNQLKTEYSSSIDAIKTSVRAFEGTSNILSNTVNELNSRASGLATNEKVESSSENVRVRFSETLSQFKRDLEGTLVSRNEFNEAKADINTKIEQARSNENLHFAILIITVILGFTAVVGTIFVGVIPFLQQNSAPSVTLPTPSSPVEDSINPAEQNKD